MSSLNFPHDDVPKDWLVIPSGFFFREKIIKNTVGEINLSVYRDYGVIPRDSRDDNHNRVSEDLSSYKLVEPGDFVLNKMKGWMGSLGVSEYRGIVSPSYTVMEPVREIHKKYFHYLLRSELYRQAYESRSYGVRVGQWELRYHDFKTIPSLYPSLEEQQLISRYLDKKTQQIDTLIENIEKKIELLKEQRTSLINHYVTKGLDPNVEMKDSGVEWIGEIPKHWRSKPIKYLVSISGGGTPNTESADYWDGDIPWVSPKDMKSDTISATEDYITQKGLKESTSNLIDPGALLIVFRSGILQRTIPVAINSVPVSINQDIKAITSVDDDFDIRWLFWFIKGNETNLLFVWSKKGATVESLESEYLTGTHLPIPPRDDQTRIITQVDQLNKRTDRVLESLERKRDLLAEYRQSLISSVVTGKVRVTEDMV